jgi:ABC-2 type transport system ATP-binding protein
MRLEASHLRKEYAAVVAVDDVSLRVMPGEVFGLIGPNGSGKTTTIRMLLDIIRPDRGSVSFDGRPFDDSIRNQIGYLPEERGLYRKNKLLNTILYFASLRGVPVSEAKRRAYDWLKKFDLLAYYDRKVEELSKGNQQKVQFIVSVLHDPRLVILDEPFSGLDPVNQQLLSRFFLELKQQGKAIIFSTHVMEQAEKLSESICLINRGKVVLAGGIGEIKKQYGKNSIRIEFNGDGAFLGSLPQIRKASVFQNYAELDLMENIPTGEILRILTEKVDIRKFEYHEPSLYSIFLEAVGAAQTPGMEGRTDV